MDISINYMTTVYFECCGSRHTLREESEVFDATLLQLV